MKAKKYLLFGMAALVLTACTDYKGYKKTENGLYYKFFSDNATARKPQTGDVLNISVEIKTQNDSVVQPATEILTMLQPSKYSGDIFEGLAMMHEGDSASFILSAEDYYRTYHYGQIPSFVNAKKKTMLWFTVCLHSIQTFDEYKATQVQKAIAEEKELMAAYLEEHQLQTEPTASGMYYIEQRAGKGNCPAKGKKCKVHYRGTLFDGTKFDSSYDRNEPFEFTLGMGQVIAGWDEGVAMMKKGGKAVFLLPSNLAYGERGAGELIKPYTPLIFEVELIDFQ